MFEGVFSSLEITEKYNKDSNEAECRLNVRISSTHIFQYTQVLFQIYIYLNEYNFRNGTYNFINNSYLT